MHHADIFCLLTKAGHNFSSIAREEKVSPSFVRQVVRGDKTSHTIANAIARKVNRSVNTLWPGGYKHDPRPLRRLKQRQAA